MSERIEKTKEFLNVAILFEASPGFQHQATRDRRGDPKTQGVAILFEASPGFQLSGH